MAKRLDGLGNEATPTVDPPGDVGDLGSGRMNLASPNSPAITGQQAARSVLLLLAVSPLLVVLHRAEQWLFCPCARQCISLAGYGADTC